jgi:hypothetical protein
MDDARVTGIGQGLAETIERHAELASRTDDPVFLKYIELSKRYFVLWYAQGLIEESAPGDVDLEVASHSAVGDIETEAIKLAGPEGFDRFEEWALAQNVGWWTPEYWIAPEPDPWRAGV